MTSVAVGRLGRAFRKPWYAFWRLIQRYGYQGHEYTLYVPFGHLVYTPWFSCAPSGFSQLLRLVISGGPMIVSPDRCYMLYQFCRHCFDLEGDMAECGVYTGGTAHLLAAATQVHRGAQGPKLHLFDTFTGMPDTSIARCDYHSPGAFAGTSLQQVQRRLQDYASIRFHPGVIPQSFEDVTDVPFYSFVHIDVDIYLTTLGCCKYFWPRLSPGGIMIFDDYGFRPYQYAERAAVDEFFGSVPEKPIYLPTGQAVVIKR